jgi:hypothetical protein
MKGGISLAFQTITAEELRDRIVGILSGVVGAGGAFILIPIMATLLAIPMRVTIVSSLAVVLLSSIGGTIGKVMTGDVHFFPVLWAGGRNLRREYLSVKSPYGCVALFAGCRRPVDSRQDMVGHCQVPLVDNRVTEEYHHRKKLL